MQRFKRGVIAEMRKIKMRTYTKGFRHGRNSKVTRMTEATLHAFSHMFAHRRKKKGDFRTLWNVRINAASRAHGLPYGKLISLLKKHKVRLNRKMLAELGASYPNVFAKLVEAVK